MNLFGKRKKKPASNPGGGGGGGGTKAAMEKLRTKSQDMDKKQAHLQKQVDACTARAKQYAKAKNKKAALRELEKRKMYEKNIDDVFKIQRNIETQLFTLERTIFNTEVHSVMANATSAIKDELKRTNVDDIGELQDDLQEAIEDANEVNEIMANPIGQVVDEAELEDDLAALEADLEEEDFAELAKEGALDQLDALPSAPSKQIAKAPVQVEKPVTAKPVSAADKELAELEAMMGM